jgi:hypothetical protein
MDRNQGPTRLEFEPGHRFPDRPPSPEERCAVSDHRERVVRRLLDHRVSSMTLLTLLPEWSELIDEADDEPTTRSG